MAGLAGGQGAKASAIRAPLRRRGARSALLSALGGATAARRSRVGATSTYYLLIATVASLLGIGMIMVLSASSVTSYARYGSSYTFFKKEVVWVFIGLAVMVTVSRVDYARWRRLGLPLVALSILGLLFVLFHSSAISAYGSTRWISVGAGIGVQPSELAKLALLLLTADVLTRKERLLRDPRHLMIPVLPVTVVMSALVMAQPDLGTTMLIGAIAFGLLFLAGGSLFWLGTVGALGLAGGLGLILSEGYRRARLFSFLDPAADPQNTGWQVIQGRFALGSGGLLGVGLGASRQKWMYLPNPHTDFIFAVIGEELGLLGTLAVVALFVCFAYAGIRVARDAPDTFGRYLAGGVTIWVTVQAVVNMGAVVGLLPITGVPLPLVSFGGSSMLVLLAAVGMLLAVARSEARGARRRVVHPAVRPVSRAAGGRPQRLPDARPHAAAAMAHPRARQGPGGERLTPANKARRDTELRAHAGRGAGREPERPVGLRAVDQADPAATRERTPPAARGGGPRTPGRFRRR